MRLSAMRPSLFFTMTVPFLRAPGGPPSAVPAAPFPQRVLVAKPTAATLFLGYDPEIFNGIPSTGFGSSDVFRFPSGPTTEVFVLAAGQPLYAVSATGAAGPVSFHVADMADLVTGGPRLHGISPGVRLRRFDLPGSLLFPAGAPPTPIAKAPPDSILRLVIRNLGVTAVPLPTDSNNLVRTGLARNTFLLPPSSALVFLLVPEQELYAAGFAVGTVPVTVQLNRGAIYGDVYLVQ